MPGCREGKISPPVNRALSFSRAHNGRRLLIAVTEFETIDGESLSALVREGVRQV